MQQPRRGRTAVRLAKRRRAVRKLGQRRASRENGLSESSNGSGTASGESDKALAVAQRLLSERRERSLERHHDAALRGRQTLEGARSR